MLKPVMNKQFISILLFLLCLLVSSPAEARLTLGVLIGTGEASGEITSDQARSLASQLAEKLQEEVVVKELSDSAILIDWLDRFAMLDLALLSAKDIESNRGRFLLIGQVDEQGKFNLVSRQGVSGDLPQRAGRVVRESGFVPWRLAATIEPPAKQVQEESPPSVELGPTTIDEVIADQTELQQVPPLRSGRAWAPQEESVYRDLLPSDEPLTKKLVLGVVPDPKGLLQISEQAERLAAYLEEVLPVSVKVREFTRLKTFTEWFMRHRMIDIAVLSPAVANANLGRDYQPIVKLFRTDKPGAESAELVVLRRGQTEEVRLQLQRVFLNMAQTPDGKALLAALKINSVLVPDGVSDQVPVVQKPVLERQKPVVESAVETVEEPAQEIKPPTPVYAEPVEPLAPPEIIVKTLPELPETAEPTQILPMPEMSDVASSLPAPVIAPAEPHVPSAIPVVAPEEIVPRPVPVEPVIAIAPPVLQAAVVPELVVPAEPPVASTVLVVAPEELASRPVPEEPVMAIVPPVPQAAVVPELVVPAEPPVASAVPVVAPEELVSRPVPEEPVITVAPPVPQPAVVPELVVPAEPLVISAVPVIDSEEIAPQPVPEEPVIVVAPPEPQTVIVPEPVALPKMDQPERTVFAEDAVPGEPERPMATATEPDIKSEFVSDKEQQKIVEEVLAFAEAVPAHEPPERRPQAIDENEDKLRDDEIISLLGEDTVAALVAQPDIPPELRPPGIPVVRPGRITRRSTAAEDELLVASIPEPRKRTEPARPPELLPEPEPEPGIIYVVPFASVMVPGEVRARIFDKFVDTLNQKGEALSLQFVILKKDLKTVAPEWLAVRKYVTGEIYAYVEDSGSNWTELRSKARLVYRSPNQDPPVFKFEFPVKGFFDHDRSTIDIERIKLSDVISATLSSELLKVLKN